MTGLAKLSVRAVLVPALLVASACSDAPTSSVPEPLLDVRLESGLVFITQNHVPDVTMGALWVGPVVADAEGCLRLGSADGATAVWPFGYGLDAAFDGTHVLDASGVVAGRIGQQFTLSGGEVNELTDAMGFAQADREAAARCPGRYWIVS